MLRHSLPTVFREACTMFYSCVLFLCRPMQIY
jgi:hypothetical protein